MSKAAYEEYLKRQKYNAYLAKKNAPMTVEDIPEGAGPDYEERQKYSGGAVARDIARQTAQVPVDVGETMYSVGTSPLAFLQRTGQALKGGYKAATDDDPKTGIFSRALEGFKQASPTEMGGQRFQQTRDIIQSGQEVPKGAVPDLDIARTAIKYGGPMAVEAPLGGPRYLKQGLQAAAGGATGAAVAEQMDVDPTIGAVAGALTGDLRGTVDMFRPLLSIPTAVAKKAWNMISKHGEKGLAAATDDEIRSALQVFVNEAYEPGSPETSPEYLNELVNKVRRAVESGEPGTIGQITRDRGILELERNARSTDRAFGAAAEGQDIAIEQRALEPTREIATEGVTEAATVAPRERVQRLAKATKAQAERQAEGLVPAAESNLAQTRQAVDARDAQRTQELFNQAAPEGVAITDTGVTGFKQLKNAVSKAYGEAWSLAGPMDQPTTDAILDYIKVNKQNLDAADAGSLQSIADDIGRLRKEGTPEQVKALDKAIRRELANSKADSNALREHLHELRTVLRESVGPDVKAALDPLDAKYPEFLTLEKASIAANKVDGEFTPSQLATASRQVGKRSTGTGDAPFYQETGMAHQEQLAGKAQLSEAQQGVRQAKQQAEALRREGTRRQKAVERSASAKFAEYEPSQTIRAAKGAMSGKTPTDDLREILNATRNNPQAREDIRRAFMDDFVNTITKDGDLKHDALDTFKKRRKVYEDSGLYTPEELDRIEAGMTEGQKLAAYDADKLAALPPARRRLLETISALAGAKVGAMAFGSPLIGAALGRRFAVEKFKNVTDENIKQLAYEMTANPEKFIEQIDRLSDPSITPERVNTVLEEMINMVGRGTFATIATEPVEE